MSAPAALRKRVIQSNIDHLTSIRSMFDALVPHRVGFVKVNAPLYERQESGQWVCVGCTCSLGLDCPPKSRGKHPVGEGWQKYATAEWDKVEEWLRAGFSIGLYPLSGCRIIGLDEDREGALDDLFASVGEDVPYTTTLADSMRDRFHLYLLAPDDFDITTVTTGRFDGGDVWRDGLVRHFVAPTMLHPGGRRRWNGVTDVQPASPALLAALIAGAERQKSEIAVARKPSDPGWEVKEGDRHDFLTRAAAHLRNAGLTEDGILANLRDLNAARCHPPKGDDELKKIARYFDQKESVAEQPRITLNLNSNNGNGHSSEPFDPTVLRTIAAYSPKSVDWLWEGWMPRAEPVIIEGLGGEGKSTFVVDLMARLSRGDKMADGAENPFGRPMHSIYITGEDDPSRVLSPRFIAAGANVSNIHFWSKSFTIPNDLNVLIDAVRATPDVAIVFIDPLFSHIDPDVNPNADVEIRKKVMDPLREIARVLDVTILIARHLNKKSGDEIALRGSGSYGGLTGAARSVLHSMTDPDDDTKATKVIGVIKANYGRMPLPWRFQIIDRVIYDDDGAEIKTSSIVWIERCDKHLDAIAQAATSKSASKGASSRWKDARDAADRDIIDILAGGELKREEVYAEMSRRGYGKDAIYDAAARCNVSHYRPGGNSGPYVWRLPGQKEGRQGYFGLPNEG